jgi:hypothetical protein
VKNIVRKILLLVLFISILFSSTQNSFAGNGKNDIITQIKGVVSSYSIVRTNYDKNSKEKKIGIFFPQISGLPDKTKQNKINKLIKDNALVDFQKEMTSYEWYDLDYTIMWSSNRLLSIKFRGNCYNEGAAHPSSFCFTVNMDINTGKRILLPDFINMDDNFVNLFINKAQFLNDPVYLPTDELSALKEDQFSISNLQYEFGKDAIFYFTSTGVVFSVYVGHAIGDYSLFSLKYSELANYTKKNTVWNNIKTDFPSTDYQIIREQCFRTNLAAFKNTWFVSGYSNSLNGLIRAFEFYLIDQDGKVKYTFPKTFTNDLGYWNIEAVAFRDINHDSKKDIIIIAYNGKEVNEAGVYLCNNNRFILDNKLNTYINTYFKNTKTVSDVLRATGNYYK